MVLTLSFATRSNPSAVETSAHTRFATASHQAGDENRWKMAILTRSMSTGGTAVGSKEHTEISKERPLRVMEK